MSNYKKKIEDIKAFVFDVDGVFTDGTVLVTESGDLLRSHHAHDGYAIRCAVTHRYPVGIISGGTSPTITKRFEILGITDVYLGAHAKMNSFLHFCAKYGLSPSQVLYMGDDIPDIDVMKVCGLPCCPLDAVHEVQNVAEYISSFAGGKGCVRDVVEQTLRLHGKWYSDTQVVSS
ncbi:MAG: HAD-IIIA family hydrolase [Prevotellaceae bacterium]|jgi:3-deoxy-D-manno-octulosonate 8-phosphate phosphatase (KDO 8-P phosphatase)|nr:HAD-IIIA family hydrolase [Prevotellaceae bacterium]